MSITTEILSNPKTASAVSVTTTVTGTATWLDWIPGDIGKLATLIGIILSSVLIVYWVRKIHSEIRTDSLRNERERIKIERDRLELEQLKKNAP